MVEPIPLWSPTPRLKLAIVMVGLPARGKSFVARKVVRYAKWLGYSADVFDVRSYQRERLGKRSPDFYDSTNEENAALLRSLHTAAANDLADWFMEGGQVGVFDAWNDVAENRAEIQSLLESLDIKTLFVEVICSDDDMVTKNIRDAYEFNPDYTSLGSVEDAENYYRETIAYREAVYEPIANDELSYVKVIDMGREVVMNNVSGYLGGRIVFLLTQLHVERRTIYLCRHGQSTDDVDRRLGGDAALTDKGVEFSKLLAEWLPENVEDGVDVWTSSLRRTEQTAEPLRDLPVTRSVSNWRLLDELDMGEMDGLTYSEMREAHPRQHTMRMADKVNYRFPKGESYQDLIERLEPVIIELERCRDNVLVVGHLPVIRVIYAYFMDIAPVDAVSLSIPLHTVIAVTPHANTVTESRVMIGPSDIDLSDYTPLPSRGGRELELSNTSM